MSDSAPIKMWSIGRLRRATQAEILRSHQRDDYFVKDLRERLIEVLHNFVAPRALFQYVQSDVPFKLAYFIFTSCMGNQTLGEEYTGIVQANLGKRKVSTITVRVLAAILECLGEGLLLRLLKQLQARINHPHSELTPMAVAFFNTLLTKSRTIIPVLVLLHKGLFYMYGRYYSLGRRIVGSDYAKAYGQRPMDPISWGLKLLGIITIAQCLLKIWQNAIKSEEDTNVASLLNEKSTGHNCQLCLDARVTTATLCGHLFCWDCLSDWLRNKPQCPLCREYMPPSRIIHLMNL